MPRRGTRRRIAKGIYEERTGRVALYRDSEGRQREKRFLPFTPIADIRTEIAKIKTGENGSGRLSSELGTLTWGVNRWNTLEQHLTSWKERRSELRAWIKTTVTIDRRTYELGSMRMSAITDAHVRAAMGVWTAAGIAPKTIRNRLWSLAHLYHVLFGSKGRTPCDDVTRPAKTRTIPTPVSPDRILTVYRNLLQMETPQGYTVDGKTHRLRNAKTRARFMVRASTGRRPSEIMRIKVATDVDMTNRIWRVRDGKDGWSEGLYLNNDMLVAFQTFIDADAEGEFNTGSQAEVLRAAGWPPLVAVPGKKRRQGTRPYALRHSVGIALSEAGIDLADVSPFLGHTSLQTTRSIYAPVLNSRMQRASEQLAGRLNGWTLSPARVPASRVAARGTVRKSAKVRHPTKSEQKRKNTHVPSDQTGGSA